VEKLEFDSKLIIAENSLGFTINSNELVTIINFELDLILPWLTLKNKYDS